jgi:hypothetical protein
LFLEAVRDAAAHATLTLAHREKGLVLRGVSPHLPVRLDGCWRASENAVFWSSAEMDSRPSS